MNVFLSVDMEGLGGIFGWHQAEPKEPDYPIARRLMTQEVNAVIRGCRAGGADTIVVRDAHDGGGNILIEELEPGVELIGGWGPFNSMVEGLDETFDAIMLIGYHPRAGTADGVLAHTWSGNVLDLRMNGQSVGEAAWAAMTAGHFGVPLAMAAGDDRLKAQLEEELPPGFHYVITKTAMGHKCARLRPLADLYAEIADTAAASLDDLEALPVFRPEFPALISLRFRPWEWLSACEWVPGVRRTDVDTFEFEAADAMQAHRLFAVLARLARES